MNLKNNIKYILLIAVLIYPVYISAQQNDSLTINYSVINSIPQNAAVYFNGSYTGNTPYRFLPQAVDSGIDVTVKMNNFVDYSFHVNKSELPYNKTISLIPKNKNAGLKEKLVMENKNNFFNTPRKPIPIFISALVSTGGAALSIVYKTLANKRYDEYLFSGDRSKLDQTKKYDLISGVGLAAFQVGFTSLIYFLLIK
jgi:hypothetical protein